MSSWWLYNQVQLISFWQGAAYIAPVLEKLYERNGFAFIIDEGGIFVDKVPKKTSRNWFKVFLGSNMALHS